MANTTSKIETQSERPHICIDGVKYYVDRKTVLLCELLLKYEGICVSFDRIQNYLWGEIDSIRPASEKIDENTIYQYAYKLRAIVEPLGWVVTSNTGNRRGYAIYFSPGLSKRRAA